MNAQQLNRMMKKHFADKGYNVTVSVTAICMDHELLATIRGPFNECIAARTSLPMDIAGLDAPLEVANWGKYSFFLVGFDNPKS